MRISEETEERVLRAARELRYRPNLVSRNLRSGTTDTIAFVSDTVATLPFAGHLIWGALDAARELDHLLLIAETEGDAELEQQTIEAMHDRQVAGIILASMYTRRIDPPAALLEGRAVLLNALPLADSIEIPVVIPDEARAGAMAARILLDAGHRDGICLLGAGPSAADAPADSVAAVERFNGIAEELARAGVAVHAAVGCAEWQPENGMAAARRLLAEARSPTAFICFNDRLALGAYQALAEAGIRVPEDISVVSFDDDQIASWITPKLTTLALPHYDLGREAVEILLAGAPLQHEQRVTRLPMPARMRDSVAPPRAAALAPGGRAEDRS
jgi:LacI family transcriptional regulator